MERREKEPVHRVRITEGKPFTEDLKTTYHAVDEKKVQETLEKALYLSIFEVTTRCTMLIRNWRKVDVELSIMYPERLPE